MADETWSEDYFIEVLSSKIPEETVIIRGVGRGRGKISQDIASLNLPKAALAREKGRKSSAPPGRGRGEFRSLMSDRPARLPKNKDTKRSLIAIDNTNHFPSLQPVSASSKHSPSSSPKTSSKHTTNSGHHSSSLSSKDSGSSWPTLSSASKPNTKSSVNLGSFAQACKASSKENKTTRSLPKENTQPNGSEIIVMRNLPEAILEEDLLELLQLYGKVLTCNIERDSQGNSLGCALISMKTKGECEWIISCFHGQEYPADDFDYTEKVSPALLEVAFV